MERLALQSKSGPDHATQAPATQLLGALQTVPAVAPVQEPEAPQWFTSVMGSMQVPEQNTSPALAQSG
jgi:hypothetical protein